MPVAGLVGPGAEPGEELLMRGGVAALVVKPAVVGGFERALGIARWAHARQTQASGNVHCPYTICPLLTCAVGPSLSGTANRVLGFELFLQTVSVRPCSPSLGQDQHAQRMQGKSHEAVIGTVAQPCKSAVCCAGRHQLVV